jgi:hypothetical protein
MIDVLKRGLTLLCLCSAFGTSPAAAATWNNANVQLIQFDSRACVFFELVGVTQSDPVVSGPWFAISKTAPNYQEMLSILLSSKLTGVHVSIGTDGTTSCTWATVSMVVLD